MKRILLALLMVISIANTWSQNILGKIVDENNNPIAYANVVLLKADSTYLAGTITDENGSFSIPQQSNAKLIKISYIGFQFNCRRIDKDNLGTITMKANEQLLQEVVIKGSKPVIKREIDRMVFNVANSPVSQGNNIMDLLKQTPLVKVTDNSIGIIGKSGVKIMVNGKISYLSSSDLVQYLKSLQSDDLASIEVITTPPSKYEAGGNGGLINIITKKSPNLGWNGTAGLTYIQRSYAGESANAMMNKRSEKSFLSLKIRQNINKGNINEKYKIIGNDYTQNSVTPRIDEYKNVGGNIQYEYNPTKASTIGAIYDFSYGKSNIDIDNKYQYFSHNQLDSTLITKSMQKEKSISHTINLFYDLKLDSVGKTLGLVMNYMHHSPDKDADFTTINDKTDYQYIVREPSNVNYSIFSGEVNLELPFNTFKMETGVKYSNVSNRSDVKYLNYMGNTFVEFPGRSNKFNYDEQTIAGYISARKTFSKYLSAQAGFRYEYTFVKGITPHSDVEDVKDNYGKLFPTIYFNYKPSPSHSFNINYARRINRPYFRAVNPFKWYTNPNNVDEGNPALSPSFADNFEFGYIFKNNLSLNAYYQKEDNAYGQILYVNDDNTTYSTYENIYNKKQFGMNLNYTLNVSAWWNIYASSSYICNKSDIKANGYIAQDGSSFDYKVNNTFSFDKDHRFQLYINYNQSLPYKVGISYYRSYANFSAGLKCAFMNNDFVFNLYGNDLFRQDVTKVEKVSNNNKQIYDNYYDSRYVRMSITYKLGNRKMKVQKKNIRFDEKNRL